MQKHILSVQDKDQAFNTDLYLMEFKRVFSTLKDKDSLNVKKADSLNKSTNLLSATEYAIDSAEYKISVDFIDDKFDY